MKMSEFVSTRLMKLANDVERLGTFNSTTLASGFERGHEEEFGALMGYLGNVFPIPVLEQALKHFRKLLEESKEKIKDELFELGMSAVTINGDEFSIDTKINVSVSDKQAMCDWLQLIGYGSIVKTSLDFDKGIDLGPIKEILKAEGVPYEEMTGVHPQTLQKAVKEIVNSGLDVPECVKVSFYETAKIKRLKK
jgi:hypothetical protein